jgi:hypothetical protein
MDLICNVAIHFLFSLQRSLIRILLMTSWKLTKNQVKEARKLDLVPLRR